MTVLVVGATGATGRLLTQQLLEQGHEVKVIVRSIEKLDGLKKAHPGLVQIKGTVLDMSEMELATHVKGCDSVCSCLGHNLTWKGMYGKPRKLVADSVEKLCKAIISNNPEQPVQFVLMNTNGNTNRDLQENYSWKDRLVITIVRALIPAHSDNEDAADYLRVQIGRDHSRIEWVVVRPDNLIDEPEISEYEMHASPTRGVIFDAGQTSRVNVANGMARLITDKGLWEEWKGQMPIIFNKENGDQ